MLFGIFDCFFLNVRMTTPGFLFSFVSRSVVALMFLILPSCAAAREAAAGSNGIPLPTFVNQIHKQQHSNKHWQVFRVKFADL